MFIKSTYWQQHVYDKTDGTAATEAYIADWYRTMNPDDFLKQYSNPLDANDFPEEQHYEWMEDQQIAATPTFFLNGREMLQNYRLEDLMAIVPGLAAAFEEKESSNEFVWENKKGFKNLYPVPANTGIKQV